MTSAVEELYKFLVEKEKDGKIVLDYGEVDGFLALFYDSLREVGIIVPHHNIFRVFAVELKKTDIGYKVFVCYKDGLFIVANVFVDVETKKPTVIASIESLHRGARK